MPKRLAVNEFLHGGDYNPEQWLDTPEVIDQDFKFFKEAKINDVTLGIFSWAKLEPEEGKFDFSWLDNIFDRVETAHGHVIFATPSGARPRWLADKYPEVLRVNEDGTRNIFGERHNHCYTSPIYRQKVQLINQKLAARYGNRPSLVLWHISNEYGGDCHCDLCQEAFRTWLKNKYHTLDNLNRAYWANFWSHAYTDWNQVHSPSTLGDTTVLALNLDWKRFVTHQTIDFYESEIKPIRKITPNIPITTNFMGGNPPISKIFEGLDYQEFAKHVDVVSWDSYPAWGNDYETTAHLAMKVGLMNDVMRSLKHQNYLIMESTPSQVNWHPYNRPKLPKMHEMGCLQEIGHGANSVNYFQLHQSRGSSEMFHGAVITHQLSDKTRTFKEVAKVGADLVKLKAALPTTYCQPKVAIVYDYSNMWALEDARDYSTNTKNYWQTIQDQYAYFWDHDIPVEMVSVEDDLSRYQLVIDPMHFMMSKRFADKLKDYVSSGGTLVGTYITGMVDENYLAYLGGWLKPLHEVYGIEFQETDTLYPTQHGQLKVFGKIYQTKDYCDFVSLAGATALGNYSSDATNNTPGITQNTFGKGMAYYLAARTDVDLLDDFYQMIDKKLRLSTTLPIQKQSNGISVQVREAHDDRYFFVINFNDKSAEIKLSTELFDVLTQSKAQAGLQTMAQYDVKVYSERKESEDYYGKDK